MRTAAKNAHMLMRKLTRQGQEVNRSLQQQIDALSPSTANLGVMYGTADALGLIVTSSVIVGHTSLLAQGSFESGLYPGSGMIIIPRASTYRLAVLVTGVQADSTINEVITMGFRIINTVGLDGDYPLDVVPVVSSAVLTRTFKATHVVDLPQMAMVQIYLVATANLGVFTIHMVSFEMEDIAP